MMPPLHVLVGLLLVLAVSSVRDCLKNVTTPRLTPGGGLIMAQRQSGGIKRWRARSKIVNEKNSQRSSAACIAFAFE
jgi:hypothetical protein